MAKESGHQSIVELLDSSPPVLRKTNWVRSAFASNLYRFGYRRQPSSGRNLNVQSESSQLPSQLLSQDQSLFLSQLEPLLLWGDNSSRLCNICASLKPHSAEEIARSSCHCIRYPSINKLGVSAKNGCPLCGIVLDSLSKHLSKYDPESPVYLRSGTTIAKYSSAPMAIFGNFMGHEAVGMDTRHSIQILIDPGKGEMANLMKVLRLASIKGMQSPCSLPSHSVNQ